MLMARDFHCGFKIAVYARTVCVRRVVEREGVIKFPSALSRKASVHAAAFSHFRHFEPGSGWVGCRRGEETALCLAVRAREPGARAGLASAGGSADAPACGQAVEANLARTKLDLGRARWTRRNAQRMNGKAKGLSDRNTFFIYDADERGSGSRACFKISRRPAAKHFGRGQGGEFRASPQRAVRNEPTPATGK